MSAHRSGAALALLAAVLFGITAPVIPRVGAGVGPLTTASLLYLGAALAAVGARRRRPEPWAAGRPLVRRDLRTLTAMAVAGAAVAPVLLVLGLARTSATTASLALNAETFFTVALAIAVHREPWRGPVALGMVVMLAGGVLLAADSGRLSGGEDLLGLALVLAATLAWAFDNTLSRAVSEASPLSVVALKGALGAALTGLLAVFGGEPAPALGAVAGLAALGATGYGASLVVYLLAQRRLGAARTGSIFGLAPFVGAAVALALGERSAGPLTAASAACFAVGLWVHAREAHEHVHEHEALEHDHGHRHDDGHHDHHHDPPAQGAHSHLHRHEPLRHSHAHAPDLHHRHRHDRPPRGGHR